MKQPCEIVVWYLLPSIRKELGELLVRELKMRQKDVSERLGLTQAAVSQYLRRKRGRSVELSSVVRLKILSLAEKIIRNEVKPVEIMEEICQICELARGEAGICSLHRSVSRVPEDCNLCLR